MAGQIRITPEEMDRKGDAFFKERDNFNDVVENMNNLIIQLQSEWEGAASESFASQFEALKPSFQAVYELIDDIGNQCKATALAVQELDNEIASKFGV